MIENAHFLVETVIGILYTDWYAIDFLVLTSHCHKF